MSEKPKVQSIDDFKTAVFEAERFTRVGHNHYLLREGPLDFHARRLRIVKGEVHCDLEVRTEIAGARTIPGGAGTLTVGPLNLSAPRTRSERAKYICERLRSGEIDVTGCLEELFARCSQALHEGEPAVDLRTLAQPEPDRYWMVNGIPLLWSHPMILFGDGGTAKSLLALYTAGCLARDHGVRVAYFDWEMDGDDHRERLAQLFPGRMPSVIYKRLVLPLPDCVEQVQETVEKWGIKYAVFDSVGAGCGGPPEEAAIALNYLGAVRALGIGSLHVAHISKASKESQQQPFGSIFWHNGVRSTWNAQAVEQDEGFAVVLYHRKPMPNKARCRPLAWTVSFGGGQTRFTPTDPASLEGVAENMSLRQRIESALKSGTRKTVNELAEEFGCATSRSKKQALRNEVNRGVKRGRLVPFGGISDEYSYGLKELEDKQPT